MNYTKKYEEKEADLLQGYADKFGELPPLNNQEWEKKYDKEDGFSKYPKDFKW